MADEQQPQVGEVRTAGTETRRWDGHAWKLVPRTFSGTEDFSGRMREYAAPVAKTMAHDLAAPVLHPLNTIGDLIGGLGHTANQVVEGISHPLTPQPDLGMLSDIGRTVREAVQGNPDAAGHVLSMAAAPKVYDGALTGTNKFAHSVAEVPAVRSAVGYAAGAGGSIMSGVGHPFMGAVLGRIASPLLERPAAELASLTDRIRAAIHGHVPTEVTDAERGVAGTLGRSPSEPSVNVRPSKPDVWDAALADARNSVPPELQKTYSDLTRQYGKETADNWLKRQSRSAVSQPSGTTPDPGGSAGPSGGAGAPTSKPGGGTPPKPGPYPNGPRTFTQGGSGAGPAVETGGGQPVMPKSEPAPRIVDDITNETADQWRERMQARIDKANAASKGAKNPTAPKPAKTSASSTGRIPEAPADLQGSVDRMAGGEDAPSKGNGTFSTDANTDVQPFGARGTAKPAFTAQDTSIFQKIKAREMSPLDPQATASLQRLRDSIGAERAAKALDISVDTLRGTKTAAAAAPGPSQLPTTVRTRVAMDVAKLTTPEDAAAYLARAKDAKVIAYIQGLYDKYGIQVK